MLEQKLHKNLNNTVKKHWNLCWKKWAKASQYMLAFLILGFFRYQYCEEFL